MKGTPAAIVTEGPQLVPTVEGGAEAFRLATRYDVCRWDHAESAWLVVATFETYDAARKWADFLDATRPRPSGQDGERM